MARIGDSPSEYMEVVIAVEQYLPLAKTMCDVMVEQSAEMQPQVHCAFSWQGSILGAGPAGVSRLPWHSSSDVAFDYIMTLSVGAVAKYVGAKAWLDADMSANVVDASKLIREAAGMWEALGKDIIIKWSTGLQGALRAPEATVIRLRLLQA